MRYILGRRRTARPFLRRLPRLLRYAVRILVDQESLLFQPVDRPPVEADELAADANLVSLATSDSGASKGRAWWIPSNPSGTRASAGKVFLVFPRATGDPRDETETLRSFRELGCSSLVVEYRRGEGKPYPRLASCFALARAAWSHLRHERKFAPSQIVLYGRSLGAAFAAELENEIAGQDHSATTGGLILHNGFSSVADLARDSFPGWMVTLFQRVSLDPALRVATGSGSVLVVHAQDDQLIPPHHGERLLAAAGTRGNLLAYPGNHLSEGWLHSPAALATLQRFLAGAES